MIKIHIIGGSSSGKTTLAESLSSRFAVPHYELDKISQKNGTQMAESLNDAFSIAEQPGWVTEGSYIIWTDPLLYQADYIVLLEIPWPVAASRMIRRHISKSLRGINPYPGVNGIKLLVKLLKDNHNHYLNKVPSHSPKAAFMRRYFEEYGERREPPDAEILLRCLERDGISVPPTAAFVRRYLKKYQEKVFFIRNKADQERLLGRIKQHLCSSSDT
ncbi:hypothetical protein [Ktedonospora formicarum]|nr:hypothetical protein [Ktedonospora formicarum]